MSGAGKVIISDMIKQITELCDPCMIFLVSEKTNSRGETTGFKLCVVAADGESPEQLETKLLLKTDCPVPCDFIVYTLSDWDDCAQDDCSFAYRVENGGEKLYVKKQ